MNSTKLWIYHLLTCWLPESRCFGLKNALLRWAGATIGQNVRVYSSARFIGTGRLEIGDDVHIGAGVSISPIASYGITIGSHVDVGPQVLIISGSHMVNPSDDPRVSSDYLCTHMAGAGMGGSVHIGDGCWLGARSMLLPGVILPRKTLVAAGAVVVQSPTTEKCLLAGVPAAVRKAYDASGRSCHE